MLSRSALFGIYLYQRWVSPRKGFRCAYSVHHGGTGCSGFAKHAIRDKGLRAAVPVIRDRLRACRATYDTYHDAENRPSDTNKRRRNDNLWCGCGDITNCSSDTSGGAARRPGCDGSDCTPCS